MTKFVEIVEGEQENRRLDIKVNKEIFKFLWDPGIPGVRSVGPSVSE